MKKKINLFYSKTNSNTKMNKRKRVVISKKKEETIFSVCENGNVEALFSLLLENGDNVNQTNKNGRTPLHIASQEGHVEIVSLLLKNRANVNQADSDGYTPLYISSSSYDGDVAAEKDYVEVVSLLLN